MFNVDKIVLRSPAKINLFLKVLGKRPDGYHRIETVFERIDLSDRIILKKAPSGINLVSNRDDLPTDERNLAYKAARLLLEKASLLKKIKTASGVDIQIRKNIPIGSGLGGGSSNAASVLLGLNKLYKLGFDLQELLDLARKLGADVAFFLYESAFAIGESRGDIVKPVKSSLKLWHVLVLPPFGVSTGDVYDSLDSYTYHKGPDFDADRAKEILGNKDLTGLKELLYNSLEEVVLARYSDIGRVKEGLTNTGALESLVSGSGPAVFGLAKTRREAVHIGKKLRKEILFDKKEWQVHIVHTR